MKIIDQFRRSTEGQTIIEFALSIVVLLLLVFGIFDIGRAVWYSNTLSFATREAGRCVIVGGSSCSGGNDPAAVVRSYSVGVPSVN